MRGSGRPGQTDQKSSDNVFFFFFFQSSAFFTEIKWLISKKMIIFKVPEGGPTFPGGVQLFPGWGVQLLIPYRNPYNL